LVESTVISLLTRVDPEEEWGRGALVQDQATIC